MRIRESTICWLQGGLGNQLFQLNAGLVAEQIYGHKLLLSIGAFRHLPDRSFELGPVSADIPVLSRLEDGLVRPYSKMGALKRRIRPAGLEVAQSIDQTRRPGSVLVGFFQDSESLRHSVGLTANRLSSLDVKIPSGDIGKRVADSVAVHVRRGDYVSLASSISAFGQTTADYYRAGLEALEAGPDDAVFFTDDPEWVVGAFGVQRSQVVTEADIVSPLQTMLTMALAPKLVMPNSTFSWWAGELVMRRGGQVAGPRKWFFDRADSDSLVNDDWVHLDHE